MKRTKAKKGKKPPDAESATIEEWLEDIGLCEELRREEPATERPPSKKKKILSTSEACYKFPRAQEFFSTL